MAAGANLPLWRRNLQIHPIYHRIQSRFLRIHSRNLKILPKYLKIWSRNLQIHPKYHGIQSRLIKIQSYVFGIRVWLMSALQATYYIIYHNLRLWDRASDWLIFIFQIKFSGGNLIYNLAQISGGREENALEKCPILTYHASN